jgi:nucleoside-diphosphate-sugar epimerase
MRLLRAGRIGDLGIAGDGHCNLAFIDDVVATAVAALDAQGVCGQAFNVSSVVDLTWNEFLVAFGKAIGATPIRRISSRQLRMETKVLAPLRRIAALGLRSAATEAITPSLAALWQQDIRIDCTAACAMLGLRPATVAQMIAAVVQDDAFATQELATS